MALPKVRKKTTNKELAGGIIEVNNRIHECANFMQRLDNVIGLYIEYNSDTKEFSDFVIKKMKEAEEKAKAKDDTETNGVSDKGDIPKDTKNKGSRSKRVRKKAK